MGSQLAQGFPPIPQNYQDLDLIFRLHQQEKRPAFVEKKTSSIRNWCSCKWMRTNKITHCQKGRKRSIFWWIKLKRRLESLVGYQVEKWKHDLFGEANWSLPPKNEEQQIVKVKTDHCCLYLNTE